MANMWRTVSVILMCLGHSLLATDGFSINRPSSPLLRMLKRTQIEPNNGCAEIYGQRARVLLSRGSSEPGCDKPVTWTCAERQCEATIIPCVDETKQEVTMNYKIWTDDQCVHVTYAQFLPGNIVYQVSNPDGDDGIEALLREVRYAQKERQGHLKVTRENGKCFVPELKLIGYECTQQPISS